MRPEFWLETVLGNQWRIRILRTLLRDPARVWTERELATRLDASPNTINLAAKALREAGVLEFRRIGRSNAIRVRQDLALTRHIQAVFIHEREAWDDVRAAVKASVPEHAACVLFGSTARGEAAAASDIDLLIVAPDEDEAEDVASQVRSAVALVFPMQLAIASVGASGLRRPSPWLQNALAEGEVLSARRPEDV